MSNGTGLGPLNELIGQDYAMISFSLTQGYLTQELSLAYSKFDLCYKEYFTATMYKCHTSPTFLKSFDGKYQPVQILLYDSQGGIFGKF